MNETEPQNLNGKRTPLPIEPAEEVNFLPEKDFPSIAADSALLLSLSNVIKTQVSAVKRLRAWVTKILGLSQAPTLFTRPTFPITAEHGNLEEYILFAAEHGDVKAQCSLAGCYRSGDGLQQDFAEAARWFRIAAENGNRLAQYFLGLVYTSGEGVEIDFAEAEKWFRMAAEQGDADAQSILDDNYVAYEGTEMNLCNAAKLSRLQNAIDQAKAELEFGRFAVYEERNDDGGVNDLRCAAGRGHAKAQNILGGRYELGKGVEKNLAEAIKWYRKAAQLGDAGAQFNLGYRFVFGDAAEKNFAEAAMWLRKAAEQGLGVAQNGLGWCYVYGNGVIRDIAEAYKWFRLAADQGNENASNSASAMRAVLPPKNLHEGERRYREFLSRKPPVT